MAVLIFEVLNATAMFNHGNVKNAGRVDQLLRLQVVTGYAPGASLGAIRETNSISGSISGGTGYSALPAPAGWPDTSV
jgi:hypothetical protein